MPTRPDQACDPVQPAAVGRRTRTSAQPRLPRMQPAVRLFDGDIDGCRPAWRKHIGQSFLHDAVDVKSAVPGLAERMRIVVSIATSGCDSPQKAQQGSKGLVKPEFRQSDWPQLFENEAMLNCKRVWLVQIAPPLSFAAHWSSAANLRKPHQAACARQRQTDSGPNSSCSSRASPLRSRSAAKPYVRRRTPLSSTRLPGSPPVVQLGTDRRQFGRPQLDARPHSARPRFGHGLRKAPEAVASARPTTIHLSGTARRRSRSRRPIG